MIGTLARRISSAASARTRLDPTRNFCLGVLPDTIDRDSESFASNSKVMVGLISQLHSHIHQVSLLFLDSRCLYICMYNIDCVCSYFVRMLDFYFFIRI